MDANKQTKATFTRDRFKNDPHQCGCGFARLQETSPKLVQATGL